MTSNSLNHDTPPGRIYLRRMDNERGFSLLELLVVVSIIAFLVTLSTGSYLLFLKKAKSVEARMALSTILKLERAYLNENNTYTADFSQLGFTMEGRTRYEYAIPYADAESFSARAFGNLDRDPDLDVWTIDQTGNLEQINVD
jgi:prepilin-type N-terminal cleavage/methylation domain-containing protein